MFRFKGIVLSNDMQCLLNVRKWISKPKKKKNRTCAITVLMKTQRAWHTWRFLTKREGLILICAPRLLGKQGIDHLLTASIADSSQVLCFHRSSEHSVMLAMLPWLLSASHQHLVFGRKWYVGYKNVTLWAKNPLRHLFWLIILQLYKLLNLWTDCCYSGDFFDWKSSQGKKKVTSITLQPWKTKKKEEEMNSRRDKHLKQTWAFTLVWTATR